MSNWVVPSIAAEMLGVPVAIVLQRLQSGDLASRTEGGFTFVDLDLSGRQLIALASPPNPLPTVEQISQDELLALHPDHPSADLTTTVPPPLKHFYEIRRAVSQSRLRPTG